MPFAVEPADRAAQGVMECLVAVTILAQGFIIDIAVVIGEIRPVVSDHQPFVVVFDPAADTPALLAVLAQWLALAVEAQAPRRGDHIGLARRGFLFGLQFAAKTVAERQVYADLPGNADILSGVLVCL